MKTEREKVISFLRDSRSIVRDAGTKLTKRNKETTKSRMSRTAQTAEVSLTPWLRTTAPNVGVLLVKGCWISLKKSEIHADAVICWGNMSILHTPRE